MFMDNNLIPTKFIQEIWSVYSIVQYLEVRLWSNYEANIYVIFKKYIALELILFLTYLSKFTENNIKIYMPMRWHK